MRLDIVFGSLADATRRGVETVVSAGHFDPMTETRRPVVSSNSDSAVRRLAAIAAARVAAEALRLEAIPEPEVIARLMALQESIPDLEATVLDQSWLLSPGERRQAEWRAEDSRARRWSGEPYRQGGQPVNMRLVVNRR